MKRKILFVFVAALLGSFSFPVELMAEFGTGGIVTSNIANNYNEAYDAALQPDGKIIAVGYTDIVRYKADGTLDASFGTNGVVTPSVIMWTLVLLPNGQFIVAGDKGKCTKYNHDGSIDTTFGSSGTLTLDSGFIWHLMMQPDGKIIAAGSKTSNLLTVARFNDTGSLDNSFGTDGSVNTVVGSSSSFPNCGLVQSDGKIVIAGRTCTNGGNYDNFVVRYNNNGTLDTSFGSNGIALTNDSSSFKEIIAIYELPNNQLLAFGLWFRYLLINRYNSDGSLDSTLDDDGTFINYDYYFYPNTAIKSVDGKYLIGGCSFDTGVDQDFALLKYNNDLSYDTTFSSNGKVETFIGSSTDKIQELLIQPDGKMVAVGKSYNTTAGNYDFALARYNGDGSLDTQNDKPVLLNIRPAYALKDQTLSMACHIWNPNQLIGMQLRRNSDSINASSMVINGSYVTSSYNLNTSPGLYNMYLAENLVNQTHLGVFDIQQVIGQPIDWQINDLGKGGSPIVGPAGIAIGDVDRDGLSEIYVSNNDTKIFIYKKSTDWTITSLPEQTGLFQDVLINDLDLDGYLEVYGANSSPAIYQISWNGSSWSSNAIAAYTGKFSYGFLSGGGLKELYTASGTSLKFATNFNQSWCSTDVVQSASTANCSVVGDLDNNHYREVYSGHDDGTIYQFTFADNIWSSGNIVLSASSAIISLAIGDQDNDGIDELYSACQDGTIYQSKLIGISWNNSAINTAGAAVNKLLIHDADNDGNKELYAACQDGHVYQYELIGSNWSKKDLGNAGTALIAMAIGTVDGSGEMGIYTVGDNAHVYEFKAFTMPATATPTITPTVTPGPSQTCTPTPTVTPTPINGFSGKLIDKKYTYFAPNPARGDYFKFVVHVPRQCEIEGKLYTTTNRHVLSFNLNCPGPGKYEHREYVGNLANGVYLLLVKAKSPDGIKERLIKKLALIK